MEFPKEAIGGELAKGECPNCHTIIKMKVADLEQKGWPEDTDLDDDNNTGIWPRVILCPTCENDQANPLEVEVVFQDPRFWKLEGKEYPIDLDDEELR